MQESMVIDLFFLQRRKTLKKTAKQEQEVNPIIGQDSDKGNNSMLEENCIEPKSDKNKDVKYNEEPSNLSKEQTVLENRQYDLSLEGSSNLKQVNDNASVEIKVDQNSNTDKSSSEKTTININENPAAKGNQPPLENEDESNSVSEDEEE